MILCFSGTGNSLFVAEKLSQALAQSSIISLNELIKLENYNPIQADDDRYIVFVLPAYSWRIPRIVEEYIVKTDFPEGLKAYFVMTCGSDIGNAQKYAESLCRKKKFIFGGCAEIKMPENYIAMFPVPSKPKSDLIVEEAMPQIVRTAEIIKAGKDLEQKAISLFDLLKSGIINEIFYRFCVKAKEFYVKDTCISCGLCAEVCPLNNVAISQNKPIWGDSCTHCMACICRCPKEAIEYGRITKKKRRYLFQKPADL